MGYEHFCSKPAALCLYHYPSALGIEAASFASGASKDIAESPTRSGTPRKEIQKLRILESQNLLRNVIKNQKAALEKMQPFLIKNLIH